MTFIVLTLISGTDCYVNVQAIKGIFTSATGSSVNIGTASNIAVAETPRQILRNIADAIGYLD